MIEDCFLSWYEDTYPDLDPSVDEMYWQLRSAYYAGWKRCLTIEEILNELSVLDQEHINEHG